MEPTRMQLYSDTSNITSSRASRKTVDGRRLTYTLNVLQQPAKARACGNGAKASADRRPVDPPPVVELRVFEGEEGELRDITTSHHNVNFFLFATLEQRPVANGRVQAPGPPTVAVLNGCNVAGINYLERPSPAGYFIFPDLSVRHEGHYRLTFSLYEQVKDPRDADVDNPFPAGEAGEGGEGRAPPKHRSSVQRLDVRSEEFQVYSAKKFPGLDRSTGLSIGLSDQGCRVRIRRDVRMRKRPKPKTNDQPIAGDPQGRHTHDGMPIPHDRSRSSSHCSRDPHHYNDRRLSLHSNDPYSHTAAAPPPLGSGALLAGPAFAMPATPTSVIPPNGTYHQGHISQPSYPSPIASGPTRAQEYAQPPSPYRPYEHRPSDAASAYMPVDIASRRSSEVAGYRRQDEAPAYCAPEPTHYRPAEHAPYRPEPPSYRSEPNAYRTEPSQYRPQESLPYRPEPARHQPVGSHHPVEQRHQPAHYSYGPDNQRITIVPEKPLLPSVYELINGTEMRSVEPLQPGKRTYSPTSWPDSLKRGMRPSITSEQEEEPFSGTLEYKRANGSTTQTFDSRRY